jgi:hypothetical protein
MAKQLFPCKVEELPVIGEFLVKSAHRDLGDFTSFSPLFTAEYLADIEQKVAMCRSTVSGSVAAKELKTTTERLTEKCEGLRTSLNKLEGYLQLGGKQLSMAVSDFGLKEVRSAIGRGNVEGVLAQLQGLLERVARDTAALTAVGMPAELVAELSAAQEEVNNLNLRQNELIGERGRLSDESQRLFNDLWESLQMLLKTAQAMYRGANAVKLKDYTVAELLRRING